MLNVLLFFNLNLKNLSLHSTFFILNVSTTKNYKRSKQTKNLFNWSNFDQKLQLVAEQRPNCRFTLYRKILGIKLKSWTNLIYTTIQPFDPFCVIFELIALHYFSEPSFQRTKGKFEGQLLCRSRSIFLENCKTFFLYFWIDTCQEEHLRVKYYRKKLRKALSGKNILDIIHLLFESWLVFNKLWEATSKN